MTPPWLELYQDRRYYEGGYATGYDSYTQAEHLLRCWFQLLARVTQATGSYLDVGAAYGFAVDEARRLGYRARGIDCSAYAVERAQLLGYPVTLGALPELPPGPPAQLVSCAEVLEHVPEALIPASLAALRAATSPGGRCVLLIMLSGYGEDDDPGHITLHDRAWWDAQLAAAGFAVDAPQTARLNADPLAQQNRWQGRFWSCVPQA